MKNQEISRRSLLGMAGAGLAGAVGARAQVTGLTPDGGTPPFRLALGALDYLDRVASWSLLRTGGRRRLQRSDGLVWASFLHKTSQ